VAEATTPSIREKVTRQVRAEPTKAGALAILLVVLGGLWVKTLIFDLGGPSPAAARGSDNLNKALSGLPKAPISATGAALLEWTKKPVINPKRNLFAVNWDVFPREKPTQTANSTHVEGQGFWDELAKSLAAKADQEKAREILAENLRAQAGKLDLQSTVMRDGAPQALVNGKLLGEGDMVDGFRIVRIGGRQIVVEREGVKIEVNFKNQ
jgi:hypothetical protein